MALLASWGAICALRLGRAPRAGWAGRWALFFAGRRFAFSFFGGDPGGEPFFWAGFQGTPRGPPPFSLQNRAGTLRLLGWKSGGEPRGFTG